MNLRTVCTYMGLVLNICLLWTTCHGVRKEHRIGNKKVMRHKKPFVGSEEAKLVAELVGRYGNYKTLSRPLYNASQTIKIYFGIALIQILDFAEQDQKITSLIWKRYEWRDEILTWDPHDYGGVDSVLLPSHHIWTPDIILYNNVGSADVENHSAYLIVDSNGTVVWIPAVKYQSSCQVDMYNFPFDEQNCTLRFGSWSNDMKKLDLLFLGNRDNIDTLEYVPNAEWEIIGNSAEKRKLKYPCCPNPYTDLVYTIKMRRRFTLHIRLVMIPTILLSTMSAAIFWIPPQRPDRTSMGLNLFSSFFLLLILVMEASPPTAKAKLGVYYITIIFMVCFGVLYSVMIINIGNTKRKIPAILDTLFLKYLGCFLCNCDDANSSCVQDADALPPDISNENHENHNSGVHNNDIVASHSKVKSRAEVLETMRKENSSKWRKFAHILDRICFFIFVVVLVLTYIFIFPHPKGMWGMFSDDSDDKA